jgi:hypothetical protein
VPAAEVGQQAQLVRLLRRAQLGGTQQMAVVHDQHPVGEIEIAAAEMPCAQVAHVVTTLPRMAKAARIGRIAGMPGFQPRGPDAQPVAQTQRGDALA